MEYTMQQPTPWYRQFWPWFIMALPASAVIAGIATVIIAVQNQDSLVVGDYYKEGLSINQSIERDKLATKMGLQALVRVEPADKQLFIQLSMNDMTLLPGQLNLHITHPTLTESDQTLSLEHQSNGAYQTAIDALPDGRWHLLIEPIDSTWRLTGRMNLSHGGQTQLSPSH